MSFSGPPDPRNTHIVKEPTPDPKAEPPSHHKAKAKDSHESKDSEKVKDGHTSSGTAGGGA